jgi:hypothetical protein
MAQREPTRTLGSTPTGRAVMDLQTLAPESMATPVASLVGLPDSAPASPRGRTMTCRCPGCGNEVTFDALVVSCACTEESDRSSLH